MHNANPILAAVLIFILVFAGLTVSVIFRTGLDILSVTSLVILGMIGFGVVGALRQPPE